MNYGTASYGSTSLGGTVVSQWFVFFPYMLYEPDVLYESQLDYNGEATLFSLFVRQANDTGEGFTYKAYTFNDPHETPQEQVTFAGVGQTVIGAARFIKVTAEIDGSVWPGQFIEIRGRVGD